MAKANASQPSKPVQYLPKSATDAIETGTRVFKEEKNSEEAIRLYQLAMQMQPNEDEARAALYNLGCAYAKQKRWKEASENIVRAINDYKLKLVVALKVGERHLPSLDMVRMQQVVHAACSHRGLPHLAAESECVRVCSCGNRMMTWRSCATRGSGLKR